MRVTTPFGRLAGLLACVLAVVAATAATDTATVVLAVATALIVCATTDLVASHRPSTVGHLRGEVAVRVPVLSSRIADPVRQPVRPRAPGLV